MSDLTAFFDTQKKTGKEKEKEDYRGIRSNPQLG
jgi:hypothetical protein